MGKIKSRLIILGSIALVGLIGMGIILAQENPLYEKIIALDAGHGGTSLGATYSPNTGESGKVYEKDVNLAVVYALKAKLETGGAKVVLTRECDETISSRKSRVDIAIEKCKSLYDKKCDALVSVHHNGNIDTTYDGTMVIYNERQDKPLAQALLDVLVPLTGNNKGLDNGGYGMTVFGHLVSALTEAYYITNDCEAELYLYGKTTSTYCDSSVYPAGSEPTPFTPEGCYVNGVSTYTVLTGDRVNQEVDALYQGLLNYFSAPPTKPGGRK